MFSRFVHRSSSFAVVLIILSVLLPVGNPSAVAQQPQAVPASAFRSSPIMFIENVSQFADGARFQVRGGNGTMWLVEDAIWITVVERSADVAPPRVDPLAHFKLERANEERENVQRKAVNVRLACVGANLHPRLEPFDRLDTVVSYFLGNDPLAVLLVSLLSANLRACGGQAELARARLWPTGR